VTNAAVGCVSTNATCDCSEGMPRDVSGDVGASDVHAPDGPALCKIPLAPSRHGSSVRNRMRRAGCRNRSVPMPGAVTGSAAIGKACCNGSIRHPADSGRTAPAAAAPGRVHPHLIGAVLPFTRYRAVVDPARQRSVSHHSQTPVFPNTCFHAPRGQARPGNWREREQATVVVPVAVILAPFPGARIGRFVVSLDQT
jgi:hypothetical protein